MLYRTQASQLGSELLATWLIRQVPRYRPYGPLDKFRGTACVAQVASNAGKPIGFQGTGHMGGRTSSEVLPGLPRIDVPSCICLDSKGQAIWPIEQVPRGSENLPCLPCYAFYGPSVRCFLRIKFLIPGHPAHPWIWFSSGWSWTVFGSFLSVWPGGELQFLANHIIPEILLHLVKVSKVILIVFAIC